MSSYFKLFLIALGIVLVTTLILVGTVPTIRNRFFSKKSDTKEKAKVEDLKSSKELEFSEILKQREQKVIENEARIERLRKTLEKEKEEVLKLKEQVTIMHNNIAEFIPVIEDGEKKNLKKLAKMFETLSPESANPIMTRMPPETLVIVLSYMKPRNSAKLLAGYASLNPEAAKRAADLTERLKNTVVK